MPRDLAHMLPGGATPSLASHQQWGTTTHPSRLPLPGTPPSNGVRRWRVIFFWGNDQTLAQAAINLQLISQLPRSELWSGFFFLVKYLLRKFRS